MVSLAAVLPFLAVLTNPEKLWSQPLVQQWSPRLGINGAQELLLPITLAIAAAAIGSDLSCEACRRTLVQPSAVQVARNSSGLIASISTDVARVIGLVPTHDAVLKDSTFRGG